MAQSPHVIYGGDVEKDPGADELARGRAATYDPLDDAVQPRCPLCRTVLHVSGNSLHCRWCHLDFVGL